MPFTHVGCTRVVLAEPEIAAVGLSTEQARAAGHHVLTSKLDLAESIARLWTFENNPAGTLGLIADGTENRLLGAYAVAPLASERTHQAAQAIRARINLDVLLDGVAQSPHLQRKLPTAPRLPAPLRSNMLQRNSDT